MKRVVLGVVTDPILKGDVFRLEVGTSKYYYDVFADVMLRIAVLFDSPKKVVKESKKKSKGKKQKVGVGQFPLGKHIIAKLKFGPCSGEKLENGIRTPKAINHSVWSCVLGGMVKAGKIKVKEVEGVKVYNV